MRLLLLSAYYSYKALFRWLRPSSYLSLKVILPLGQVAFFALIGAYGGGQSAPFYLVGNAMVIASISGVYSVATAVTDERREGTLVYLLASPGSRVAIFYGRALLHVIDGALNVAVAFAWVAIAFGLAVAPEQWVALAAAMLIGTAASAGLGLLVGAFAYLYLDVAFLANLAVFAVLLLSGTNIPLSDLPAPVRAVSELLPLTASIAAARELVSGATFSSQVPLLVRDLVLGAVYGAAAFALFQWTERQARRSGSLVLG